MVLKKITGNALWLIGDRLLRMVVSAGTWVLVVRQLGPEAFGGFSYLTAIYMMLAPVAAFGLDSVLVRDLVQQPRQRQRLLSAVMLIRLLMAGVCWLVMVAWVALTGATPLVVAQAMVMGLGLLGSVLDVVDLDFQSRQLSRLTVTAKTIPFLLAGLARVWVALNGADVFWLAGTMALESLLGAVALWLMSAWHKIPLTLVGCDWAAAMQLARAGLPFLLSGIAVVVYMRIDQVMLLHLSGPVETGLYAGAARLSEFLYFLPTIVVASAAPVLYELRDRDRSRFLARLGELIGGLVMFGLVCALGLSVLSPWLTGLILGDTYWASAPILAIHAWSLVFVCVGVGQSVWDSAESQGQWVVVRTALGALTNVTLNLWLIPLYGGVGAAVATLMSYALSAWIANLLGPATRPMFWLQVRSPLLFWNALGGFYARIF